ncbi:MAG: LuxR C-terminal-related transcriptional regulator [Oscillospiraceae bacterium]|jgi:DNA-binding NarL/FixJ family response regulator|nr:LuxR C-terminal-related transcriptional regulator [Oscillospiraceae bacterium]
MDHLISIMVTLYPDKLPRITNVSPAASELLGMEIACTTVQAILREILASHKNSGEHSWQVDLEYSAPNLSLQVRPTRSYADLIDVPRKTLITLLTPQLTPREVQTAILLFEGQTIRAIASHLKTAEGTVKKNIYNIYRKLGVNSQIHLIQYVYARLAGVPPKPNPEEQCL